MVYCLLDVRRLGLSVRALVSVLEDAVIELLAGYGITAQARPDAPGVYVNEAKIASLGLRLRQGRSYHGLSLNVAMDLEPYARINPCGYAGLATVDLSTIGVHTTWDEVAARLGHQLATRLSP